MLQIDHGEPIRIRGVDFITPRGNGQQNYALSALMW